MKSLLETYNKEWFEGVKRDDLPRYTYYKSLYKWLVDNYIRVS